MYVTHNPKLTMRQAAEQYVADCFPGRSVGEWRGDCFQLKDGVKWYRVRMTKIGWEVFEVDHTPPKKRPGPGDWNTLGNGNANNGA